MEIIYYKSISSTHKFLIEELKNGRIDIPKCIVAQEQTDGIGSRGNKWIGKQGNLFLSLCVDLKQLPKDLPLQSSSIYFAYIFKEIIAKKGSKIWVKWPNDFYIKDKKIGGVITHMLTDVIVCSIGLNIAEAPMDYDKIDIVLDREIMIKEFVKEVKKFISWKKVFSKYRIEFQKSKKFHVHSENKLLSLNDAKLNFDGSISINNKKVYNSR